MNELIKVNYTSDRPTVSARDLHEFLEVDTPYRLWFPRMCEYGFTEGQDFNPYIFERVQNEGGRMVSRTVEDAQLTIEMAKEICMLQRNEKGKIARQYFIQLEKDWNSPEKVMARALQIADKQIKQLQADNASLTVQNQIMQPKAAYFDDLVDRNLLTNFRDTAKELGVKEKGKLMPCAGRGDGLFEVKECFNEKTNWTGVQTLVTPKGRETFRLLCEGM